ncbi:hypothetical protein RM697_11540 [Ichthyenterobacterium sp. W332]|uniref:Tim44-like domain-containing protein n=1 Tax=Microcosmobacter mediterraneus TaxID=3075607 RepID=A0ABU2YQE7_9FLAO|nr:hypothetical protein [Ichthyenterobacterium sp. W332]MDT0559288.1 hypothetical protein [Ichthyenterobacterium sp. W332]
MKPHHKKVLLTILIIGFLFYIDPVYAGPGGSVVKGLFKTWWGKLLLFALCIIFFPLIVYTYTVEFFAIRKTKKQLNAIGLINRDFSWLNLQKNVYNVFTRVYEAWDKENMKEVSEYVNHWYWQNQQQVHIDRWKRENLKNICKLDKINSIKPVYAEITDEENFEGSKIAFIITANIKDYLINRDTGKIVEGKNVYGGEEHIWIMEYTEGKWLLDDIREGKLSLAFAKMKNVIPELKLTGASNSVRNSQ